MPTSNESAIWDPNTWSIPDHEFRIYGDERATTWAVVDEIDYHWAIQWRWNILTMHGGIRIPKPYLRRSRGEWQGSLRLRQDTLLLHVEIMKRTGVPPPSPKHRLVDHKNRDSLNCRRVNLHWVTHSMNNLNRNRK